MDMTNLSFSTGKERPSSTAQIFRDSPLVLSREEWGEGGGVGPHLLENKWDRYSTYCAELTYVHS